MLTIFSSKCDENTQCRSITLDPDVTMNQFQDFLINKWIPAYEKNFQGGKVLVLKGVRGENKDDFATLNYFKSEKDRNKYWSKVLLDYPVRIGTRPVSQFLHFGQKGIHFTHR